MSATLRHPARLFQFVALNHTENDSKDSPLSPRTAKTSNSVTEFLMDHVTEEEKDDAPGLRCFYDLQCSYGKC
ncbi:hypothetical protein JOB18_035958 [Solea senegalensis]|uniref:Uncharacterized protein n=1 Tax=Solea senegalensis TaxID=28829 RepID=A0AAV6RM02_SOLSE|nr:hypothetical protein JOB18_035958 [Solea senegalensis]